MPYETQTEYASDSLYWPDAIYEEQDTRVGRYDGWLGAFVLFSIIFGPKTPNTSALSPLAFIDVVAVVLGLRMWIKSNRLYGGFLFTPRIRIFSIHILILTAVLVFATMMGIALGKYSFVKGAFYMPVILIRTIFIAAIMASLNLREKQIKQLATGMLAISLMTVILAFVQRYRPYYLAGFVERFYETKWHQLEIARTGMTARVVGTFGNTNVFGICMVILAVTSLVIGIYMKGLLRLVAISTFVILAAAILIATGSRTAFLALVMTTGILLLLSLRGKAKWPALILMILIGGMLFFALEHIDELPINPRIKAVLGGVRPIHETLYARYVMWEESIRRAKTSIIWGTGTSTETGSYITDNGYLYTLLLTGIMGLGTYLSMLGCLLIRGLKTLRIEHRPLQRAIILASFIVLIGHMIFEITGEFFWVVQYGALFGAFMGVLCGTSAQSIEDQYYSDYQDYELDESEGVAEMSFQEFI